VREGKSQVAIDDVRELIAALCLKSHRSGRRVGIIDPADAMNVNGANALLKTLEEPGAGALLVLVAAS
jgi:DNA polymerase III subunit delta'